jgi:cysteine synthase
MLRAYGAEVVITPTAVDPHSPESYYAVSDRLAEEIPGGFKPDQYSNPANPEAHYETTGPELWEQTDGGDVDAVVISVGTGGTITGVGRYLREQKPDIQIIGADPVGSIFSGGEDGAVGLAGDLAGLEDVCAVRALQRLRGRRGSARCERALRAARHQRVLTILVVHESSPLIRVQSSCTLNYIDALRAILRRRS